MSNKKIAFVGINSFDIIIYLTRILANLRPSKCLCVDSTTEGSLITSVPVIRGQKGVINYRGIDFIKYSDIKTIKPSDYEYIFIEYGKNLNNLRFPYDELQACDEIFYVTDLQKQNVEYLRDTDLNFKSNGNCYLIIRDTVPSKININYVSNELEHKFDFKEIFNIPLDYVDYNMKLTMQHNNIFKFNRITGELKDLLIELSLILFSKEQKEVMKAFKSAEKGA